MFTVKKIHLGQVRYKDGLKGKKGFVPPGFAVCSHGTPLVWKDIAGKIVFEVFDLKYAAEEEAAYFNQYGFGKVRVTTEFS